VNRWIVIPRTHSRFLRSWFDDLLLVPCALPVALWLFRRLRLRANDNAPRLWEFVWITALWSLLFEWIGPKFVPHTTADWRDVIAYFSGGIVAWLFWQWHQPRALIA
jgi:hypothetical protein